MYVSYGQELDRHRRYTFDCVLMMGRPQLRQVETVLLIPMKTQTLKNPYRNRLSRTGNRLCALQSAGESTDRETTDITRTELTGKINEPLCSLPSKRLTVRDDLLAHCEFLILLIVCTC